MILVGSVLFASSSCSASLGPGRRGPLQGEPDDQDHQDHGDHDKDGEDDGERGTAGHRHICRRGYRRPGAIE